MQTGISCRRGRGGKASDVLHEVSLPAKKPLETLTWSGLRQTSSDLRRRIDADKTTKHKPAASKPAEPVRTHLDISHVSIQVILPQPRGKCVLCNHSVARSHQERVLGGFDKVRRLV